MTRQEIEDYVWNFLKNKGLADEVVAEIMGNIEAESEFNPDMIESGTSVGFGLCQWSYTRREQLEAYGTDLQHQLNFLWGELTGGDSSIGCDNQWFDTKGYTYSKFINNQYSIDEGTKAFCWCFERPNEDLAHIDRRVNSATTYYDSYKGSSEENDENAEKIENAVQWAINIAEDDTHGYDQENRWGVDYDCSSLVISAYEQAGVPLKSSGATYTGNMKEIAIECGFNEIEINDWEDTSQFKRGDIILNEVHHVCMYIGDGKIVQASINENGETTGGESGDQTGKEIYTRDYYVYSSGWDCCLRLGNGNENIPDSAGEVYEAIENSSYKINQLSEEEITFLKTLSFGDRVKMKHSFKKNKKIYGINFFGNRLKSDDKEYIIVNVRKNGFIILDYAGNGILKYINPKFVKGVVNNED